MYESIPRKISNQVLLRHGRPRVNPIQNRHRHPTAQMRLDVTMQQERSGVDHLIPDRHPRRRAVRRGRGEPISQWGVNEVEVLRDHGRGFGDGAPVPGADALADDEGFVGVFVDGVRGGDGAEDLDHDVDPGAVGGGDGEVGVLRGGGGRVEEEGGGVFEVHAVAFEAGEGPEVFGAGVFDLEEEGLRDGGGGGDGLEGGDCGVGEGGEVCG